MLNTFLNKETIQFKSSVTDWKEAINIVGKPLLEKDIITEKYIENIIENATENGPYFVLDDYFAMPHAKPGEGVNKIGLSLLKLDKEVNLLGKPVKVFLMLSAIDSDSHLEALSEISTLMLDRSNFELLINGSNEQVLKLFK